VRATVVTADHCTHAELTSEHASASCYSCCVQSRTYLENKWKVWDGRSVGNVNTNVCAKFRCAPLRIKKALGIFWTLGKLITTTTTTTTTTTRVAFWDPPSGSKEQYQYLREKSQVGGGVNGIMSAPRQWGLTIVNYWRIVVMNVAYYSDKFIITRALGSSAADLLLSCVFVFFCPFLKLFLVNQTSPKVINGFWWNFFGGVGRGLRTKWLDFEGNPVPFLLFFPNFSPP